jgi:uncharacterized membrane protein HdeD (DUF308 family)/predicted flap endonuclease-1-like 5' DNA nuclease
LESKRKPRNKRRRKMMSNAKTLEEEVGLPWWLVLLSGVAAILLGLLLFAKPAATLIILIQVLGVYWLITGGLSIVFLVKDRREWGWKLFSGILGIMAGILIILNPLWSTLLVPTSLAILVGAIGIVLGVMELVFAFRGGGWGVGVLGVLSILLGLLLLSRPVIAGLALPFVLGGVLIGGGILALIWAFGMQNAERKANAEIQAKEAAAMAATRTQTVEVPKEVVETTAAAKGAAVAVIDDGVGMAAAAGAAAAGVMEARSVEPAPAVVESAVSAVQETSEAAEELKAPRFEAVLTGNVDATDVEEMGKFRYPLEYVEGIGPIYAAKLKAIGLVTCLDLLQAGASRKGREEIASKSGIAGGLILKWVNHVDLYRIKGVGSEYADLLEVAGVDTVVELAQRNPGNLLVKVTEVNVAKELVRKVPTAAQVEDWISQAKGLPRVISY